MPTTPDPVGYWTMFGPGAPMPSPDPDPDPGSLAGLPAVAAPDPVYHSVITGTFDPTPAEIVAAAAAKGEPVPPGVDPVSYSRMMSGLPPLSTTGIIPMVSLMSMATPPTTGTHVPSMPVPYVPFGSPLTAALAIQTTPKHGALTQSISGGEGSSCLRGLMVRDTTTVYMLSHRDRFLNEESHSRVDR